MKRGFGPFFMLPARADTRGHFTGLTGTPVPPSTFRSAFLPCEGYDASAAFQTAQGRRRRSHTKADPQRLSGVTYDVDQVEMKYTLPPIVTKREPGPGIWAFLFIGLIYANLSAAVIFLLGGHLGLVALAYVLGGVVATMVSILVHGMLQRRATLADAPEHPEHQRDTPAPGRIRETAKAK